MAGSRLYNSEHYEEEILFWVIVQACRDIVYYGASAAKKSRYVKKKDFLHAYEWILDDLPQQIGDREYTFREALEAIGVHPDNVEHMRNTIARGPGLLSPERKQLARDTQTKLEGEEYEPEPFWRNISTLILNTEAGY